MLTLHPGIADAIRRHGVETYPNECCGALIGADDVVEHVAPLPNTTEEGARRRFLIRPPDYKFVEAEATRLNRELLGFYHSHPDHPARWSSTDLAEAHWFGCSYIITGVAKGNAGITNSFLLMGSEDTDKEFSEERIVLLKQGAAQ